MDEILRIERDIRQEDGSIRIETIRVRVESHIVETLFGNATELDSIVDGLSIFKRP